MEMHVTLGLHNARQDAVEVFVGCCRPKTEKGLLEANDSLAPSTDREETLPTISCPQAVTKWLAGFLLPLFNILH